MQYFSTELASDLEVKEDEIAPNPKKRAQRR